MTAHTTLLSDFLKQLNVPHTSDYTDRRFRTMPFQTLFGLSKLLEEYGIDSEGLTLADNKQLLQLTPPYLAHTRDGIVIVTAADAANVSYITEGEEEKMPLKDFDAWCDGHVFLAFPSSRSTEPHYMEHRRFDFFNRSKGYVLWAMAAFLFIYLFISNGIYRHWSTVMITLFDLAGIYLTYLLVQKSLNIHNKTADKMCGVLEKGGCDSILALKASKFFGLFGWSEVGFAYFSVSLLTLLVFPQWTCYLAVCNACCLPFTCWSIWYQKFRAKRWCTLCVSVQCTLWLLFFCYLGGGMFHGIFPLRIEFFVLAASYITVLLGINRLTPLFDRNNEKATDNTPT